VTRIFWKVSFQLFFFLVQFSSPHYFIAKCASVYFTASLKKWCCNTSITLKAGTSLLSLQVKLNISQFESCISLYCNYIRVNLARNLSYPSEVPLTMEARAFLKRRGGSPTSGGDIPKDIIESFT
jgi:hypothetical protein